MEMRRERERREMIDMKRKEGKKGREMIANRGDGKRK